MTMPTAKPDELIVLNVISGDTDAYAVLMERYEAKLLRYVVYLIHDNATARDIVQDSFIKAYQNLQGFNPKYKFSSWLYRIAHNEAMNAIKKHRHMTDYDIDMLPDVGYDQQLDTLLDDRALKANVHECLDKLDIKYREVIQLVYFEHMKYEEVSDVLHIPTSTVGVWVLRAKAKLRDICEQKGVRR